MDGSNDEFRLRRNIGLAESVAVITGIMVGSGIFVSPTGVLAGSNNSVGLSLVVWAGCGAIALVGALCYCELGSCVSISGGDHTYLHMSYGPIVAFCYCWCSCLIVRATAMAALALTVANYAVAPFYSEGCDPPQFFVKTIAASVLLGLSVINCFGVKPATRMQQTLTCTKFLSMGIIIVGGIVRIIQGDPVGVNNFTNAFHSDDLSGVSFSQLSLAFYQGLWAYDGWSELNMIAEEVKDSHKTIPRAILIALPLVTVFYLLVNISYFAVLTPDEMLHSNAVAVTWASRVLGPVAWIIPLGVCLSSAGALNGALMSGGRLPFAAARRGHFPEILAMAHVKYYTPLTSIMFLTLAGLFYLLPNDFSSLVNAFTFAAWLFYGLAMAGVLVMRITRPDMERPFKVPVPIPVLAVVISAYLLIAPLVHKPDVLILYALGFFMATPVAYYLFVYRSWKFEAMNKFTLTLQKVFQVLPTIWDDYDEIKSN
uniref:B(0,+)-type amino acid transporter 1-like n=1 Tax=Phallusia mammillata TaxID=59560 RepID=A0A6F9DT77_9ASCI|nr:b(0,+)-type amino acid transporter 1-like [Phallusia mammillata]